MKSRRVRGYCIAVLALMVFAAATAWASEAGESPVNSGVGWLLRWLNFALLVGAGFYFLRGNVPAFFRGRAAAIAAAIRDAGRAKDEAERRMREAEEKLSGLDREVAVLRGVSLREAETEAERIRTAARDEAQKIARAAELERAAAERAARMELKALAARLAVERAEAILRKQITAETQGKLVARFVNELAGSAK